MPKKCSIGGMAVIEGVMMRGPQEYAIAVRLPDSGITIERRPVGSVTSRFPWLKWPLIRGVVALIESLTLGMKALTFSANQAAEGQGEEITRGEMLFTITLALVLGIGVFVVLPTTAIHLIRNTVTGAFSQNLLEGVLRIALFLGYVLAISRMKDIQRVFQYHGAEHKVIHVYEADEELTAANARKYTTLHPRCGTSFLLIVMVISILIFSFLGQNTLVWRIGSRILLLPVVAGLAYEVIKLSGRHAKAPWMRVIITPGLWLQKLTTREPDDDQVEVAIQALKTVMPEE